MLASVAATASGVKACGLVLPCRFDHVKMWLRERDMPRFVVSAVGDGLKWCQYRNIAPKPRVEP